MIDAQKFAAWVQAVQGQYINMDGAYGAQCWDLHAHFADWFGLPRVNTGYRGRWVGWAGNMYDAYPQTPAIESAYERVPASQPAEPGDQAIWSDSYWYYPATHVAVVVKDGPQLLCMSQNSTPSVAGNPYPGQSTGPTTLQHLPKGGLLGYLRPRGVTITLQGSTTSEEDDMSEALDKVNLLVDRQLENHLVTQRKLDGNNLALNQKLDSNHLIIQRRLDTFAAEIAGLRGALAAATTNPGITPESLTAAFKEAVGEFSITLTNVGGK
jgi:hypothetical protein